MLHKCEACPGKEVLVHCLENKLFDVESNDKIFFNNGDLLSPVALQLRAPPPPQSKRKSPCAQVISL